MMEQEEITEEAHKKKRVRKKQRVNTILNQMHFYFGDANLSKDRFLSKYIEQSEFVDLSVFLTFNKIQKLTSSIEDVAKALRKSDFLELDDTETKVKRKTPVKVKECVDECIIYVQTIQPDTTHEWLTNVFSEFGQVDYVSIPKFTHSKINKGFAFIEYETPECAKAALDYFASINCLISTQINAEELCSIKFEGSDGQHIKTEDIEITETKRETTEAKRETTETKRETTETKRNTIDTKRKIDEVSEDDEEPNNSKKQKVSEDKDEKEEKTDEKKKKKKSSKRISLIKEIGLKILSKNDWRLLRNRYWEMQRKKMKQLKQHFKKKKFHCDTPQNQQENPTNVESTEKEKEEKKNEKDFTPGVIVKLQLKETVIEAKKSKNDLKATNPDIQYVEIPVTLNSSQAFLRFSSAETAKAFCVNTDKGEASILQGEEEQNYWAKINQSRNARQNKDMKKQRGREKLLKRAERELGKHIRFDDSE